jgi:hypothetical protein
MQEPFSEKKLLAAHKFSHLDIEITRRFIPYELKRQALGIWENKSLSGETKKRRTEKIIESARRELNKLDEQEAEIKKSYNRHARFMKSDGMPGEERWATVKYTNVKAVDILVDFAKSPKKHGNHETVKKMLVLIKRIVNIDEGRLMYKGTSGGAEFEKQAFTALDTLKRLKKDGQIGQFYKYLKKTGELEKAAKNLPEHIGKKYAKMSLEDVKELLKEFKKETYKLPEYTAITNEILRQEAKHLEELDIETEEIATRKKWKPEKLDKELALMKRRESLLELDKLLGKLGEKQRKPLVEFLFMTKISDVPRSPFPLKDAEDK